MFTHVLFPDTKERVVIESENVKHFNPLSYRKNQLYKVQFGESFKNGLVLHVAGKNFVFVYFIFMQCNV